MVNASQMTGTAAYTRANSVPPVSPTNSDVNPDASPNIDTDTSSPANAADMVPGASLSCSYSQSIPLEARCTTLNKALERFGFEPANAYIVKTLDGTPLTTELRRVGTGIFAVAVPANISGSFAISFANSTQKITDWIIDPIDSIANKVGDGGFELLVPPVTGATVFTVDPESSPIWSIKAAGSDCASAGLEVHRRGSEDQGPSQGEAWVQLDSKCPPDDAGFKNMAISQDLKLVAGNAYEVKFDYRKGNGVDGNILQLIVGDEEEVVFNSAPSSWTTYSGKFIAKTETVPLQFLVSGPEKAGAGLQLDHIRVFDLGPSSSK